MKDRWIWYNDKSYTFIFNEYYEVNCNHGISTGKKLLPLSFSRE